MNRTICLAAALLTFAGLNSFSAVLAGDWTQWRGPHFNGLSDEKNIPVEFGPNINLAWKVELPGSAGATPVVSGDHIFVSSADGEDLVLLCFGTDGSKRWVKKISSGDRFSRGDEGNLASPSPVTDGKHVWTLMGDGMLTCHDFDGNETWRVNLEERLGKIQIGFMMSSTPVLLGDALYFQWMHQTAALVFAIDKNTGKEIWKVTRKSDAKAECLDSYASPVIYQDQDRRYLVTHGADFVIAHSLKDGKEIWRCGGFNPPGDYNPTLRLIASPAPSPGLIVVPTAKNRSVLGIDPASQGDITETEAGHVWTMEKETPDVPSPLIHEGLVYLCRENGELYCLDAKTGEEYYHERAFSDRYRASPVYADGRIYFTSRKGVITVVQAGKDFKKLAENHLEEEVAASPALAGGRIYIRSFTSLFAFEEPKP